MTLHCSIKLLLKHQILESLKWELNKKKHYIYTSYSLPEDIFYLCLFRVTGKDLIRDAFSLDSPWAQMCFAPWEGLINGFHFQENESDHSAFFLLFLSLAQNQTLDTFYPKKLKRLFLFRHSFFQMVPATFMKHTIKLERIFLKNTKKIIISWNKLINKALIHRTLKLGRTNSNVMLV